MNIFLDVETIPTQNERYARVLDEQLAIDKENAKVPSNYKDPVKIEQWYTDRHATLEAERDERWQATSLNPTWGELICCVMAIEDEEPRLFTRTIAQSEQWLLSNVFALLQSVLYPVAGAMHQATFIGWAIDFDLRFLWQRAIINNLKPPPYLPRPLNMRPMTEHCIDLMQYWAGWGKRIKQREVCHALGVDIHDDIDGSEVWRCVQVGDYDKVNQHCIADVQRMQQLAERMGITS